MRLPVLSRRLAMLLALACLGAPRSSEALGVNISGGLGLMNIFNLGLGFDLTESVSLEGYLGTSLLLGTASAYLEYKYHASPTKILKVGAGPAAASACGHGCGESVGFDVRTKYVQLLDAGSGFGYYIDFGAFIGKGNLFGSDPTYLPHISVGLNWKL